MSSNDERQVLDRDRATRYAMFAVSHFSIEHPAMQTLPRYNQDRIVVETALAYLIGHGLIEVKPQDEWPEWLETEAPAHLLPDVNGQVARWEAMQ